MTKKRTAITKKLMTKNKGLGRFCTNRYKDHLKTRSSALQADSLLSELSGKPSQQDSVSFA